MKIYKIGSSDNFLDRDITVVAKKSCLRCMMFYILCIERPLEKTSSNVHEMHK